MQNFFYSINGTVPACRTFLNKFCYLSIVYKDGNLCAFEGFYTGNQNSLTCVNSPVAEVRLDPENLCLYFTPVLVVTITVDGQKLSVDFF